MPSYTNAKPARSLPLRRILRVWWPLAASWLLMTAELPLISAVIARLAQPEINLAAWGVVFALSIIIQAPSTMLLAASTALSRDWASYRKLRRITFGLGVGLTALHAVIAFTPLYFVVIESMMGAPAEIVEPVRLGLMIMTPWSWGTAYRRFQQGVLIRFDHAQAVIWGSILRVSVDGVVLAVGYTLGGWPGVVVGTSAITAGVLSEALYAGLRVRPVLNNELKQAPPVKPVLTLPVFANFYVPLAITMLLTLIIQPMVSAALSRMPSALESLAVWPVVIGVLFVWQSVGIGYNEAVIALLDEPHAVRGLRHFTTALVVTVSVLLLLMLLTPLATLWFAQVAALAPPLIPLATQSLWLGLLLPGLRVLQSWYQGTITYSRHTRGIIEAVIVFLIASGLTLWGGVLWGQVTGIYVGIVGFVVGFFGQTVWLWYRSRPILQAVQSRDMGQTVLERALSAN